MKLLLLFLLVGAVLLMGYFGERVRPERADEVATPT
jgi:Na+-transporting methylmalonyl-CoA/oxaloacetate decarboxylase gamma subunit